MAEAIRGRVSPYTFLGRYRQQEQLQQQTDNADTSLALRRNQFAIANVNSSLIRITEQINVLSASLQGISNQIKETSTLESLKDQQKARQERILAEQQIREGKESQIERKIQAALVMPVRKIGAKAQGTLFSLTRFFNILLGGFLLNRILDSVAKLSKDGNLSLKNLGDSIVKDLAVVGGIFLAINGGFLLALNSITRLAFLITRIAVKGLILRPIMMAVGIAGNVLKSLATGIKNLPRIPRGGGGGAPPPRNPPRNNTGAPPAPIPNRLGALGGAVRNLKTFGRSTLLGAIPTALLGLLSGESVGQSSATALGFSAPLAYMSLLGPIGLKAFAISSIASIIAGSTYGAFSEQIEQAIPAAGYTIDDLFGTFSSSAGGDKSLIAQEQKANVSIVDATGGGGGGQVEEVPSATSDANYLPSIESSNPSNFYLVYSKIQYNVVG